METDEPPRTTIAHDYLEEFIETLEAQDFEVDTK
jgi:hypothetical protein